MAWKVMIADDESIIRDGIRSSVPWAELGLDVACEAEDGEQALELALLHRVHILLVDIRMPIMDGLELVSRLREELPECRIIIITGHDEFGYAHEAINLNVDGYILKPVNPDALGDMLGRVAAKLEAATDQDERLQMASRQIEKNVHLLRERFGLEWIGGELERGEIEEQLAFLRLPVEAPSAVGALRWPDHSKGRWFYSERDRQLLLFAMENIVDECLQDLALLRCRDRSGCIVLFVWGRPAPGQLDSIAASIARYLGIEVQAGFRETGGDAARVPELYLEAKAAVSRGTSLSELVRKTKERIEAGYPEPQLSLERTASELNVSAAYLSRIFKQETGTSFVALLAQTRIKQALRLLIETDLAMHEIAEQVGYETQHYFSTAFKKAVGIPPIRYRKGERGR